MMGTEKADKLDSVRKIVDALSGFEAAEQELILRVTREFIGLSAQPTSPPPVAQPFTAPPVSGGAATNSAPPSDIRTFYEAKKPSSDVQFAAMVAYYYRFEAPPEARKDSITKDDLQEACRQVGRQRPKSPAQTLVNAHGQGLLDRGEPGEYTINTVGENLVAMALPSDGSVATASRVRRKQPQKVTRKSATKPTKRPTADKKRAR